MGLTKSDYPPAQITLKGQKCALTTGQDGGLIPLSGLQAGDVVEVHIYFRMTANDSSTNDLTVRINDGADKNFAIHVISSGVNQVYCGMFLIGDGQQIATADWNHDAGAGNSLYSTTAITIPSVASIKILNSGGGSAVINGFSIMVGRSV